MELELDLVLDAEDAWLDTLVVLNQRWLSSYARIHPSFSINPSLLERNSLWMNAYFQKHRMITSPYSKQAKTLLTQHQQCVVARLRGGTSGALHQESEFSTTLVDPMAALMFAVSVDRCPEYQLEHLMVEALELLQIRSIRAHANLSGFAGCIFRFLTSYTEVKKRILSLQLLLLLAEDDAAAVVQACKVAAQGQLWQPNMFIYTLQKRHHDNETIQQLVTQFLPYFSQHMPISSPIQLENARSEEHEYTFEEQEAPLQTTASSPTRRTYTLPALRGPTPQSSPHRPTTTISTLYIGVPSPYSPTVCLPIARPPTSPQEQHRRSAIYSTPKEKAVIGDRKRRCLSPNLPEDRLATARPSDDLQWMDSGSSTAGSPPKSPGSTLPSVNKRVVLSEKYSWNPECSNSVSGFEWWWRSLPQHHTSLEPTQKLKMVTKAAVRLHTKGEWERASELYLLALSMEINEEVEFRLRVNLACAFEIGKEFGACQKQLRQALQLNPNDPYARFKLGSVLKELEVFDEAQIEFEAVLDAYPQAEVALQELEAARNRKRREAEAREATLLAARAARSPSKPGRSLHSRNYIISTKAPRGKSNAEELTPVAPKAKDEASGNTSPPPSPTREGLVECIARCCAAFRFDLRSVLLAIDRKGSGMIRRSALEKLFTDLCGFDAASALREELASQNDDVIEYEALVNAVEAKSVALGYRDVDTQRNKLNDLVASLQAEEAEFYTVSPPTSVPECEARAEDAPEVIEPREEEIPPSPPVEEPELVPTGPTSTDVETEDEAVGMDAPQAPAHLCEAEVPESESEPLTPLHDELRPSSRKNEISQQDGYTSLSARPDEKRGKAREEAILRAERARVVARRQLHCLKALQDVAVHARKHLMAQHLARLHLQTIGCGALEQCRQLSLPPEPQETENAEKVGEADRIASFSQSTCNQLIASALLRATQSRSFATIQALARDCAVTCTAAALRACTASASSMDNTVPS
ncbi:hypothetical protein Poli38472_010293 [Pythium oligandrum]|uniref:Uncharacterized protein n=1 Tax=Pythium oligandrum TaxID=41045 RepID=A0A8K1C8N8_PYTOL|nr:hypothetical protein Poli38472_010293 [Pythium oligandrum]|eukprot:TMW58734.1 hypothetical protein Poli38472_010293 [Pythium oligandrum]